MAFGVTEEGFVKKRLADIKSEIEDTLRSEIGAQINLLPESVFSQIVGIFAERESLIWDASEDVYNSQYPDTAFGVSLDNVAAITGITRQGATASRQESLRLFGTAATVVPQGTQFQVSGNPNSIFESVADAILGTGVDEQQTIAFDAVPDAGTWRLNFSGSDTNDLAFDAPAATIQAELNALPFGAGIVVSGDYATGFTIDFAGAAGKQEQETIVLDDNQLTSSSTPVNITIAVVTEGQNQAVIDCVATVTGPTTAPAGTLTVIVNPVAGLDSVINVTDADVGRDVETDNELRQRRAETLQVAGAGTPEAIRSRLLNLDGVIDAFVFENQTFIEDANGRPPKSFEPVVSGGDEQEIIDLLWQIKPAGISTFGQISGTTTDSQGQSQDISFSRPTDVEIFVEIDLTVDPNTFPANGLATAEQLIVDRGNEFGIGNDVIVVPTLLCALDAIPGILDVALRVGTSASPTTDDNIAIAPNEVAVFDTGRTTAGTV